MAKCRNCGKKLSFTEALVAICTECDEKRVAEASKSKEQKEAERAAMLAEAEAEKRRIESVLLTTESAIHDLRIVKRLDVITVECAFGMNIFKDLFASARDFFGGRSAAVQNTMRESRQTALNELRAEAHRIGANAVIGIDLDYVELSGSGNMVLLVASGTAVVIEGAA
ncbi:YbjQ family protein [Paracoccus ravus]|uniref:YbjQ family protein n=1 Tax=Paracoccus ravus TaxID=2447760 RepID=UPI00106ED522|nr:YbjQ family protein [Paracoccus ravus]